MIAILDAGPLYATVDAGDRYHAQCLAVLQRADLQFVVPVMVVAEVTYLVGERLGPSVEAAFLSEIAAFEVEAPTSDDWKPMADLVQRYADFPLGSTDASVVVLADRLGTDLIATLDRRHFSVIRSARGHPFRLLPE